MEFLFPLSWSWTLVPCCICRFHYFSCGVFALWISIVIASSVSLLNSPTYQIHFFPILFLLYQLFFLFTLALMSYLCLPVCLLLLLMLSRCLQFLSVPHSHIAPKAPSAWAGAHLAQGPWAAGAPRGPSAALAQFQLAGGDAESPPNPWGQASSKDLTNLLHVVDLGFCLPGSLEAG